MDLYTQESGNPQSSPVDIFLAKQRVISTPIIEISRKLDNRRPPESTSMIQPIPGTMKSEEYQYAFQVDLDKCSGCKACVSACHSMNGLGDDEAWRDVGALIGNTQAGPYFQTITTACHHCLDPACANGCPVLAYEKDPVTGIVRHLDDQCIGCQYCVLKCPYDVPKYSKELGIVRKCDMCYSRLQNGENTACVNACPTRAISIITVSREHVKNEVKSHRSILPGTHPSSYTLPTTKYVSMLRDVPSTALPADFKRPRKEHAHWPLVHFLIWTQISVGLVVSLFFVKSMELIQIVLIGAASTGLIGIVSSVFHLGKPLKAWRIFLGLRKSWLSREAVTFGLYIMVLIMSVVVTMAGNHKWIMPMAGAAAVSGLTGVYTSIKLYQDTQRRFWSLPLTANSFLTTVGLSGAASASVFNEINYTYCLGFLVMVFLRLSKLVYVEKSCLSLQDSLSKAAHSIKKFSGNILVLSYLVLITAAITIIMYSLTGYYIWAAVAMLCTLSEFYFERYMFFTNSDAGRMPGGL